MSETTTQQSHSAPRCLHQRAADLHGHLPVPQSKVPLTRDHTKHMEDGVLHSDEHIIWLSARKMALKQRLNFPFTKSLC